MNYTENHKKLVPKNGINIHFKEVIFLMRISLYVNQMFAIAKFSDFWKNFTTEILIVR